MSATFVGLGESLPQPAQKSTNRQTIKKLATIHYFHRTFKFGTTSIMCRCLFILGLFLGSHGLAAQENLHSKSKKAIQKYQEAKKLDSLGNWFGAIPLLQDALKKDKSFDEVYLLLFQSYLKIGDIGSANNTLKRAGKEVGDGYLHRMLFDMAVLHYSGGNYEQAFLAIRNVNGDIYGIDLLTYEKLVGNIEFARNGVNEPLNIRAEVLPYPLNTFEAQYFPSLTGSGQLIFTGRDKDDRGDEDLYITSYENNRWHSPLSISNNINTDLNEGTASIAADGQTLVFTGCNRADGLGSCDLYISYFQDGEWSLPENLGSRINSAQWESQPSLSYDGSTLYFSSDRPGGLGGQDLWVSRKISGKWTMAKNLGNTINTIFDDSSPYLYPNGNTLYFASKGHLSFGGYDLFQSTFKENKWTKPSNLGYPINNSRNQIGYSISTDGWAYYSDNDFSGHAKLYRFKLPDKIKPQEQPLLITGVIRDATTKKGLSAEIIRLEKGGDYKEILLTVEKTAGKFSIAMEKLEGNEVIVRSDGYIFKRLIADSLIAVNPPVIIELVPIGPGQKIPLSKAYFSFDSYELDSTATNELEMVANFLLNHPEIKVEIRGYTDHVGTKTYNLTLSEQRARAVYEFFLKKNVSKDNLAYKRYGEAKSSGRDENPTEGSGKRIIDILIVADR